jgi:hypothetical protein
MTDNIISALIGSSGAILAGAFIFWLNRRAQSRQERRKIISEIVGRLTLQYRLFKDRIAHETWYHFYYSWSMAVRQREGTDMTIYINHIERRLSSIEDIWQRLMDNEIELIKLHGMFVAYYPDDNISEDLGLIYVDNLSLTYNTYQFAELDIDQFDLSKMNEIVGEKIYNSQNDFTDNVAESFNNVINVLEDRMYELRRLTFRSTSKKPLTNDEGVEDESPD